MDHYVYHEPPANVQMIPNALTVLMERWNIKTARMMDRTCLILPATVIVNALVFLLAVKLTTFKKKARMPFIHNKDSELFVAVILQVRTPCHSPDR